MLHALVFKFYFHIITYQNIENHEKTKASHFPFLLASTTK